MSYNSLKEKDTINTILIVASRTVSRYTLKLVRPFLNYDYQKRLQPSKELLNDWNTNKINKDKYTTRYFKKHKNIKEILNELAALEKSTGKEVILLCHCGKYKFCHTKLLLEIQNGRI